MTDMDGGFDMPAPELPPEPMPMLEPASEPSFEPMPEPVFTPDVELTPEPLDGLVSEPTPDYDQVVPEPNLEPEPQSHLEPPAADVDLPGDGVDDFTPARDPTESDDSAMEAREMKGRLKEPGAQSDRNQSQAGNQPSELLDPMDISRSVEPLNDDKLEQIYQDQQSTVEAMPKGDALKDLYGKALDDMSDDEIARLLGADSDPEKAKDALDNLGQKLADGYGIDRALSLTLDPELGSDTYGGEGEGNIIHEHQDGVELPGEPVDEGAGMSLRTHNVVLNPETGELVESLGHEVRHAVQSDHYANEKGAAKDYSYASSQEYGDAAYGNQPVEQDAYGSENSLSESLMEEGYGRIDKITSDQNLILSELSAALGEDASFSNPDEIDAKITELAQSNPDAAACARQLLSQYEDNESQKQNLRELLKGKLRKERGVIEERGA
jgi:hypothetical protein